jgi:2-keto-3-deoxy-L-rhamnonate aldolase RhmA
MIGVQDLALSLGVPLQGEWLKDEALSAAIAEIRSVCEEAGVVSAIGAANGKEATRWIEDGFRMVNLGSDLAYLRASVDENMAIARGAIESTGR